jgi:CheY-like chemotaxis protein
MEVPVPDQKSVILCVDDEAIPLTLRKCVLEKFGYEVIAAGSGAEALQILDAQSVDLVLTDLLMPGLSGTDLAREIKQRKPHLPVVLFSGVNEVPEGAEVADMFLSKVEGPVSMCEKLGAMLKSRGPARSAPGAA